ncbi:hypothetical protein B0T10DRAFT_464311 [Thelonectria olida]|uniref:Uncharacterized protein n=1 Tax=Thelonectria olida TaxID=1576542 RepID=A0A9P8VV66_9HYPO|nr:hypothetical protein B0T10DRAFT_464311 [Thelonectria olida]
MQRGCPVGPDTSPWKEGPPSPQEVDYDIWLHGGITTAFDSILTRDNSEKTENSIYEWVITLNQENGRLQHESHYYKSLVDDILIRLPPLIRLHSDHLCGLIGGRKPEVGDPETSFRFTPAAMATDMHPPRSSYDHGLVRRPNIPTQQLVIELTRENGKLRHCLAQDRNLVIKVLMHLVPQLQFHCDGLYSVIRRFNEEIKYPTFQGQKRSVSLTSTVESIDSNTSIVRQGLHDDHIDLDWGSRGCQTSFNECLPKGGKIGNSKNTIPSYINNLKHRVEELRFQYRYYSHVVNYGLTRVLPLVRFHSSQLLCIACRSSEEIQKSNIQVNRVQGSSISHRQ